MNSDFRLVWEQVILCSVLMSRTLYWNHLFPEERFAQLSVNRKSLHESFPLHDHDFPELFWVTEGAFLHKINGQKQLLSKGCLLFIRPSDQHSFAGASPNGASLSNICIHPYVVEHLRDRYFKASQEGWWHGKEIPEPLQLSHSELHLLEIASREFAIELYPTLFETERFVMEIFQLLHRRKRDKNAAGEPEWLSQARRKMQVPEHLTKGVSSLVKFAGRSPEHLARTVRKVHGLSPTELVNRQRLDWAASELMFSAASIAEISLAAGFDSLSHFYHLFRKQHSVTPKEFRSKGRVRV